MAWLTSLPLWALYIAMAVIAAIENVFPPIPADSIVAFGSFLAAQGKGSIVAAFLVTWLGNVGGAAFTYALGRKYGAERIEQRLLGKKSAAAEGRLRSLYDRFGVAALFFSRFLPAVRAIVPPFAGALRIPAPRAMLAIGAASGLWYGLVAWLAFRLGEDWERVADLMAKGGTTALIVLVIIAAIAGVVWWFRRRSGRAGG